MHPLDLDHRLITLAQSGDARARHRVLSTVAGWLPRAVAMRYPTQRGRDDLCQEVLLQVHLGLDRIQEPEHFKAWTYGVLRNCTYARLRAERRDRSDPTERVEDLVGTSDLVTSPHSPEDISSQAEAWERGRAALDGLTPKLREVYALYLEEHTLTEIAELLELPRGTVASRLRTAQATLRRRLGSHLADSSASKVHHFPSRQGG